MNMSSAEIQARSIRFAQREVEVCGFTLLAMKINRADAKTPHQKRVATTALRMAEARAENARRKLARELRA